jgi:hypothetical protein
MGSGLHTDNSPPGEDCCAIIAEWNRKHGDRVHVVTATQAEFFAHLEKTPNLPVHRGEWTDWWSDGPASTPVDTILYRNAQRSRVMIRALDPKQAIVPDNELTAIDKKLLLYAEHTFGYSATSDTSLLAQQVFTRKSQHAIEADELSSAALYRILRRRGEGEFADRRPLDYRVINPLAGKVRSAAYLPLDRWETPLIEGGLRVVDAAGRVYPHQIERRPRGAAAAIVVELDPGEERRLKIEPAPRREEAKPPAGESFENAFYRARWDGAKGLIEIVDKSTGAQILSPDAAGGLGCPVYQVFPKGSRNQAGRTSGPRTRPRDEMITFGRCTRVARVASGSVLDRWEFHYQVPGATRYVLSATFFHALPQIELTASMEKVDVRDPEGMYVFFPVAAEGGIWRLDKPGAPIRPGLDQLPGACCDYYCIQHGAALAGKRNGVIYTTLDAPLIHLGKLRLWNYSTSIEPTGPIYSWLTNNKWETNFRISNGGAYEFRYVIEAGAAYADPARAMAQCRALSYPPLVARA